MKSRYDPLKHHRRSTRLQSHDYSTPGAYFVTVCVEDGREVLSRLENGEVFLRYAGKLVEYEWLKLPDRFGHVQLDDYVVMPDHFHAILWLTDEVLPTREPLGRIMGFWKHRTVCQINDWRAQRWNNGRVKVWQRGFYDRIIRDDRELNFVRDYIRNNPRNAPISPTP